LIRIHTNFAVAVAAAAAAAAAAALDSVAGLRSYATERSKNRKSAAAVVAETAA